MGRSSVVTFELNVSNLTTTTLIGSFQADRTQTVLVLGFPDCDNDDPTQDENKCMKVPCMPFAMSVSCDQSAHCSSGGCKG